MHFIKVFAKCSNLCLGNRKRLDIGLGLSTLFWIPPQIRAGLPRPGALSFYCTFNAPERSASTVPQP